MNGKNVCRRTREAVWVSIVGVESGEGPNMLLERRRTRAAAEEERVKD